MALISQLCIKWLIEFIDSVAMHLVSSGVFQWPTLAMNLFYPDRQQLQEMQLGAYVCGTSSST